MEPVALEVTCAQVLAWRLRRQFLTDRDATSTTAVVRRLAGVQAQVGSPAQQAVAVRRADHRAGVDEALERRVLIRTWAMRGTLHLLAVDEAPAVLSLLTSLRTWEKGSWQKEFASAGSMRALAEAVDHLLADAILTREELVTALGEVTGTAHEQLRSGWGTLLKPLAWQGLLCNATPRGGKPTFTHPRTWVPGWPGLPDADVAAHTVVQTYLGAHGPASPEAFDAWLLRGSTPKRRLRAWFDDLVDVGALARLSVDGEVRYARVCDLDELADTAPAPALRLLPAFDQYVLGPGTADARVVPARHRAQVSRAAGRIAPVIVERGRVTGTWTTDDERLVLAPFDLTAPEPPGLADELTVWSEVLGRPLSRPRP